MGEGRGDRGHLAVLHRSVLCYQRSSGWPTADPLSPRFQLLWARAVEPDAKSGESGAIYLWVEELDENNVPGGMPRSYRLPYSRPLAERSLKAATKS